MLGKQEALMSPWQQEDPFFPSLSGKRISHLGGAHFSLEGTLDSISHTDGPHPLAPRELCPSQRH